MDSIHIRSPAYKPRHPSTLNPVPSLLSQRSTMSLTSPLAFAFDLLTAQIAVALSNVPGCLPDETATIVLQSIFQVPDLIVGGFANLTVTNFKVTCPSREASAALPKRGILDGVGRWAMATGPRSARVRPPLSCAAKWKAGFSMMVVCFSEVLLTRSTFLR
jgi:hypothetical protein